MNDLRIELHAWLYVCIYPSNGEGDYYSSEILYTFHLLVFFFSLSDNSIPAIVLCIYVIKSDLMWNWRQFIASDKCTIISVKCDADLMRSWQCNDHKISHIYFEWAAVIFMSWIYGHINELYFQ